MRTMMITNATMSVRGDGASATNTTTKRIARSDAGTDATTTKKRTSPGHGAPSRTTGTKTVHGGDENRVTRTSFRGPLLDELGSKDYRVPHQLQPWETSDEE